MAKKIWPFTALEQLGEAILNNTFLGGGNEASILPGNKQRKFKFSRVRDALGSPKNPKTYGAIGDNITDDSGIINSVISGSEKEIRIHSPDVYYVPTYENLNGIKITGSGKLMQDAVGGGKTQINSENDNFKYVFGREYLSHFHQGYIDGWGTQPAVAFSGDSTTEGASINPGYFIHELFGKTSESLGLNTPFGLALYNQGHSGDTTTEWLSTYLALDLAIPNLDLYFVRWGINDASFLSPEQFLANMRTGMTTIRGTFGLTDLSVVLMTPSSTNDTPNGRDASWYERIIPGLKEIAREFSCVFIDTYSYLRDSGVGVAGDFMDNPFANGIAIHPLDVMNIWISSLMTQVCFPENLKAKHGQAELVSLGGTFHAAAVNALPDTYVAGQTISRGTPGNGWPLDGSVVTIRSADGTVFQINYPYLPADNNQYVYRFGNVATGVWSGFRQCGGASVFPTPAAGYSAQAPNYASLKARRESALVCIEGYILKDVESGIVAGDTIATFQSGYRPAGGSPSDVIVFHGTIFGSSGYDDILLSMDTLGTIKCVKSTAVTATRVHLCVTFSGLSYVL